MKVFSMGEMVIDFLPGDGTGVYIRKPGGAPANLAVAMARLGAEAEFCGMMGNDDFGRFLVKTLEENNVKPCVRELTDAATTTLAFVTLDESGDRSFTFARKPGADMFLTKEMVENCFPEDADIVHAGSCSLSKAAAGQATRRALEMGAQRGKLVSFDINYRGAFWDENYDAACAGIGEILKWVDLLKLSDEEIDMLGGEDKLPELMARENIALTVMTRGAKGARCYWNGRVLEVPGVKSECVDTCGAGDAFWGGFLATLLRLGVRKGADLTEEILMECMRMGNVAGALCVRKKGAIESLPTWDMIEESRKEMYAE